MQNLDRLHDTNLTWQPRSWPPKCIDSLRMSIFPILAAAAPASFPPPDSTSYDASGGSRDFSQMLQQLGSGASPSSSPGAGVGPGERFALPNASADAAPAPDMGAILHQVPAPPSSPSAALDTARESAAAGISFAVSGAKNADSGVAGILDSPERKTAKAAGKSTSIHAKNNVQEADAKVSSSAERAPSNAIASAEIAVVSPPACGAQSARILLDLLSGINPDSGVFPASAASLAAANAGSAADVSTPRVSPASADSATLTQADSSASAKESSLVPDRAAVLPPGISSGALAAEVQASAKIATAQPMLSALIAENGVHAAFLNTAAADEVKAKPKLQAAMSSGKAGGAAEAASSNEAASASSISTHVASLHPSLTREEFMQGDSPINPAMFRSGTDPSSRQEKIRSRGATASQGDGSSVTPGKSAGGEHDANPSLAAEGGTHLFPIQATEVPPAAAPAPAPAAADAAQTAAFAASAVPAQTSQEAAPAAAQPQPQPRANALPDAHPVVDSGQLRVSGNNSELKISVQLPDLGKVEVRAVSSHDVTTAHLTTFHRDALQVLSADRSGLEQALKSRDVILGTLDSHSHRHSAGQQRQQNSQSWAQSPGGTSSTTAVATTSASGEAGSAGILPDYSSISVRA